MGFGRGYGSCDQLFAEKWSITSTEAALDSLVYWNSVNELKTPMLIRFWVILPINLVRFHCILILRNRLYPFLQPILHTQIALQLQKGCVWTKTNRFWTVFWRSRPVHDSKSLLSNQFSETRATDSKLEKHQNVRIDHFSSLYLITKVFLCAESAEMARSTENPLNR